ncbi:MAG: DegT/DnrJ/EryC1/StrS family aminotransferase [Candidatus Hydrogenedentota bacterium]
MSQPFIPIAKPWVGETEVEAAQRPIRSGWLTQGPEVAAFEKEFASLVGAPHACAVSNCTTALHLALLAAGVGPGDEVIVPSHTYIATANSIRYCGATPVFVDIELPTFNIDPALVELLITPKTKAVLSVHQMGMPCDLRALIDLCRRRGIVLVEDAACASGSEILWNGHWEKIGRPHGDVACFSFHPRKVVTTGDGGMVTTSKPEWDAKFRLWRQHGMSVPDTKRHGSKEVLFEAHVELGFNYRMTDVQAAIGREQLKRLPEIISRRRAIAERYHSLLEVLPNITRPHEPEWARSNWQSYCVLLPESAPQKVVMQTMLDMGIATRRGVMCIHGEPAYAGANWHCGTRPPEEALRSSVAAHGRGLMLPLFYQMTDGEQDRVVEALKVALHV